MLGLAACSSSADGGASTAATTATQAPVATTATAGAAALPNEDYAKAAASVLGDLAVASSGVADVMVDVDFDSDAWNAQFSEALAVFAAIVTAIETLDVPPEFADVHASLTAAATGLATAAELLERGVADVDVDAIEQASEELVLGVAAVTEAGLLLDAAKARLGIQ